MPSKVTRPGPICEMSRPSTVTEARVTLWMTAFILNKMQKKRRSQNDLAVSSIGLQITGQLVLQELGLGLLLVVLLQRLELEFVQPVLQEPQVQLVEL
jgi:hypothetical protein